MLMHVGEGNTSFDGARRGVADASPAGPVQSLSGITSSLKLCSPFSPAPRPHPVLVVVGSGEAPESLCVSLGKSVSPGASVNSPVKQG